MLRNYFKILIRNFWRNKVFSTINIVGLALGLACSILILLWVQNEHEIDAFHQNINRLYYVYERNYIGSELKTWYWTQGPLAEELKKEIPEIQSSTQMSWSDTKTFTANGKTLKQDGFAAGADYFTMFSYPLIVGNAIEALASSDGIVISQKMAIAFFGSSASAIGKTIRYENKKDFIVKAVFEDQSPLVSNKANFIMPWLSYQEEHTWAKEWAAVDPRTCILIRPGSNANLVEKKIEHFLDKFPTEQSNIHIVLALQHFKDYYLHSAFRNGKPTEGRIEYVHIFTIVALFILVIACINFMNLSTARSVNRAKEIGVRKVVGANRSLLVRQFIGEAVFMAFLSLIIALIIVNLTLSDFNQLTGKDIQLPFRHPDFWLNILWVTLITGLLAGSYPAFYLSKFNPLQVLKSVLPSYKTRDVFIRKGLVVFQFVLSIVFIFSTIIITRQIRYMQNARLGYQKENLLYVPLEGDLSKNLDVFRNRVINMRGVQNLSMLSENNPSSMSNGTLSIGWIGKDPNMHERFIQENIGPDFLKTMKIDLVEGRDFAPEKYPTDSTGVILNQTAITLMEYKDPIGKMIFNGDRKFHIVGVVKDFHFQSLHDKILPLILTVGDNQSYSSLLVRAEPGKTHIVLLGLEKICKEMNPAFPFEYEFFDAEYGKLYNSEEITKRLSMIFATLAIFISCLGLLGLSLFTTQQRTREITIRKVLGASIASLFWLLSNNFLKLIILAFAIAAPVGGWVIHQWLSNYAYRIDIPFWPFVVTGVFALLLAMLTVCWQAIYATTINPAKTLRTE